MRTCRNCHVTTQSWLLCFDCWRMTVVTVVVNWALYGALRWLTEAVSFKAGQ